MLKRRIIPVILLRNGVIVQSKLFKRHQPLGTPTAIVERLANWESDEVIYLDISPDSAYDLNRDDLNHPSFSSIEEIIKLVSKKCQMPLSFGGGIKNMSAVDLRIKNGADKITINSLALENPDFITEVSTKFGSQCVVISIDVNKEENGEYFVYKRGKEKTSWKPDAFAQLCESKGAGEILLNAIHRDGTKLGFDIELINLVCSAVKIPVIAMGGAGTWEHFEEVLIKTSAAAVAAANIFQHTENSVYHCKKFLHEKGLAVRKPCELSELNNNL